MRCTSQAPPLIQFGILVAVCLSAAFLGSLVLLPALVKVFRPRFLGLEPMPIATPFVERPHKLAGIIALGLLGALRPVAADAGDRELPSGDEVVARIRAVDDGEHVFWKLAFHLIDRHGKERTREARYFRKEQEGRKSLVFFFDSPRNVKGTAFLTFDYAEPGRSDDRWLYLPALRKVRRISASDRGSSFLGTDFTYDDIRVGHGITIEDYRWRTLRAEEWKGHLCYVVEGTPVSDAVALELGYGRTESWVDTKIWKRRKIEFWDVNGNALKVAEYTDLRKVQGLWTPHVYEARNLKTGHRSRIQVREVDYQRAIDDDLFSKVSLRRGG